MLGVEGSNPFTRSIFLYAPTALPAVPFRVEIRRRRCYDVARTAHVTGRAMFTGIVRQMGTVRSVESTSEGKFVTVSNPWGVDGRVWDLEPDDGMLRLTIHEVQDYFIAAVTSSA